MQSTPKPKTLGNKIVKVLGVIAGVCVALMIFIVLLVNGSMKSLKAQQAKQRQEAAELAALEAKANLTAEESQWLAGKSPSDRKWYLELDPEKRRVIIENERLDALKVSVDFANRSAERRERMRQTNRLFP